MTTINDDVGNPAVVGALRKLDNEREKARNEELKHLMTMPRFRSFITFLEHDICGLDLDPYTPEATVTAFNCGARKVGLRIRETLREAAPDLYLLKEKERIDNADYYERLKARTVATAQENT